MSQYSLISIPPYQFLLPLAELKEVRQYQKIHNIPQAPDHVRGLFPLRGKLCTLLCLPTLLMFKKQYHEASKLIIIEHRIGLFAIEAKSVDIISLTTQANPPPLNLPFSEWIRGIYPSTEYGELLILDFSSLEEFLAS